MRSDPFGPARAPLRFLTLFVAAAGIIGVWSWYASQAAAHKQLDTCNSVVDASVMRVLERSRTDEPLTVLVALPDGLQAELDVSSDAGRAGVDSGMVKVAWCPGKAEPLLTLNAYRSGTAPDLGTALFVTFGLAAIGSLGFLWVFKPTDDLGDPATPE